MFDREIIHSSFCPDSATCASFVRACFRICKALLCVEKEMLFWLFVEGLSFSHLMKVAFILHMHCFIYFFPCMACDLFFVKSETRKAELEAKRRDRDAQKLHKKLLKAQAHAEALSRTMPTAAPASPGASFVDLDR